MQTLERVTSGFRLLVMDIVFKLDYSSINQIDQKSERLLTLAASDETRERTGRDEAVTRHGSAASRPHPCRVKLYPARQHFQMSVKLRYKYLQPFIINYFQTVSPS
jgi:hypothetical protein